MPPDNLDIPFLMRVTRVSASLPEMTQQIHSLRAKGVMSFHTASALGDAAIAFLKSAGRACTSLVVTTRVAIGLVYQSRETCAASAELPEV